MHDAPALLTAAEVAKITGKRTAPQQARVLLKMGVPFRYLVRAVEVSRKAAEVHELLPEARPAGGIDFGAVRR